MADLAYPQVNGNRYDWSSIIFRVRGSPALGVREISYRASLEPGDVYGAGSQPIGRTRGQMKYEGSITLLKAEAALLMASLGAGFLEQAFDIVVHYKEGALVMTDTLIGCRIKSPDQSFSQSADALSVKLDLHVMRIFYNFIAPGSQL